MNLGMTVRLMKELEAAAEASERGDGTERAGYARPDVGPFMCGNCRHFDGKGRCDHPEVIADQKVKGIVEAKGCCNYFKHKLN